MTLYYILVAVNCAIAIANGLIFFRCWRTMRKVDRLQAETAKTLAEALRFKLEHQDYGEEN